MSYNRKQIKKNIYYIKGLLPLNIIISLKMKVEYSPLTNIKGRYITIDDVECVLQNLDKEKFIVKNEGSSVENRPLYSVEFGSGLKKIIIWSQMHGNEATTTKAVLDWLNRLNTNSIYYDDIASNFSICVLPMVNPDGAFYYTRANANNVDLNRDSVDLSQPESVFLRNKIVNFNADLALNMHDQRTIFGVGETEYPATISFLSPAYNENRTINNVREIAMQLIGVMYNHLHNIIPNQIGRFDDSFNINCIGDYVTNLGVSTILFEAGHYPNDYQREKTRQIVYEALFVLLESYKLDSFKSVSTDVYWNIKENSKNFNDIRIVGFVNEIENMAIKDYISIQYIENVQNKKLLFDYSIDYDTAPNAEFAHKILNAKGLKFKSVNEVFCFLNENVEKM